MKKFKTIYLDHAATTPMDPKVKKAMEPYFVELYGNPSSLYHKGIEAKQAIDGARNKIAKILNCKPEEIIFCAGGTESVNLAIFGLVRNLLTQGKKPHLITTKIEHHAVLHSMAALEKEGCSVTYLGVDKTGFVSVQELEQAIKPETVLVSVMYANNEIGTIEPIAQIGKLIKKINSNRGEAGRIFFHSDACQAGGVCDLNTERLGVDLITLNGSKIYGPKQSGILYVKNGVALAPLIYGGGQEKNLRSGTENVASDVGVAKAMEFAQAGKIQENLRLTKLRDYFITKLFKLIDGIQLNGPIEIDKNSKTISNRLPNNINFSIPGIEGEALLLYLDSKGICVSTGSACNSQNFEPSHVLMAIGKTLKEARGTIRITLGKTTKKADLDYVAKVIGSSLSLLKRV